MGDKKRVNLTVNPETKAEWDDAVEQSAEYSSLSDLIRQSVAHELSEPAGAADAPQGPPQSADMQAHTEALEQVTETLGRIESTLSDLDSRLTAVEQEVTATAQADLKNEVFDAMPEGESVTPEQVADEIGADSHRVGRTLRALEEQTGAVTVSSLDGRQYFTRETEQ